MDSPAPALSIADQQQLGLLSILYYVYAALMMLLPCLSLIYVGMGAAFLKMPQSVAHSSQEPPPAFVGWGLIALGAGLFLVGLALAFAVFLAGRSLSSRRRYVLCLVVAGVICLNMPLGTALGVFTFLVLLRPSVQRAFGRPVPP